MGVPPSQRYSLRRCTDSTLKRRMSACGRKLPLISVDFSVPERPLSGKAVIRKITHLFVMLFSIFAHEL
jgi:hypothetical protein